MTAAINDSTTHLKALEAHNTSTHIFLESLTTRLEAHQQVITQQSMDISALGQLFNTQNQLVTALQQTQIQQGNTIDWMITVQNDLVSKTNQIVTLVQGSTSDVKDHTAVGPSYS